MAAGYNTPDFISKIGDDQDVHIIEITKDMMSIS
jgi:hypothetical protein